MTPKGAIKAIAGIAAVIVLLFLGTLAWMKWSPRRAPAGQPPLATVDAASLPAFRATFNAAHGTVRVVALLSPT